MNNMIPIPRTEKSNKHVLSKKGTLLLIRHCKTNVARNAQQVAETKRNTYISQKGGTLLVMIKHRKTKRGANGSKCDPRADYKQGGISMFVVDVIIPNLVLSFGHERRQELLGSKSIS